MTKLKEAWTLVSLSLRLLKKNPFLFGYMLAAVLAVTALFSGASYPVVCNWRNNVTQ